MDTNISALRVVHVTVPLSVASNLEKMQEVTRTVLGKLGCAPCHSGFALRFNEELSFRFNERAWYTHEHTQAS